MTIPLKAQVSLRSPNEARNFNIRIRSAIHLHWLHSLHVS